MPNQTASSPASPYAQSVLRLEAGDGDSGDDLTMALARKLVSGDAECAPVEDIFQQAQQIAAQADQLMVDADWQRTEPQPSPIVTLLSGAEPAAATLAPCGWHHSLTHQEQATLFSWAEFLADPPEPTKPQGRSPRPTGPSLFDWPWNANGRPDWPPPEIERSAPSGEVIVESTMTSPTVSVWSFSPFKRLRRPHRSQPKRSSFTYRAVSRGNITEWRPSWAHLRQSGRPRGDARR